MSIFWPESQVITTVNEILSAIGREFTLYVKTSGTPCPQCLSSGWYDPVTNSSTNSFCTICQGVYWLNIPSGIILTGHVKWNIGEIPYWNPGGIVPGGDCIITIPYSSGIENKVKNSLRFLVDNKDLTLKGYRLRGVKNPNRIIITLKMESSEN